MLRKQFPLFVAALVLASQAASAATTQTSRSVGAFPVVYDDYPEANVTFNVGDDVVLTVTGEARTRFEWVENTVDFSTRGADGDGDDEFFDDSITFAPARFDIGFRVDLPRDVAAVIDLQSGFDFGDWSDNKSWWNRNNVNQHMRPGALNRPSLDPLDSEGLPADSDDFPNSVHLDEAREDRAENADSVHLYQGYIEAAHIGGSMASLRFGRQELAYGSEFMLGNQDWYDGLSYDGLKLILEISDKSRVDLFWAKLVESQLDFDGSDNDQDLYGVYWSLSEMGSSTVGVDVYGLAWKDRSNLVWDLFTDDTDYDIRSSIDGTGDDTFLESYWVGVRFFREREHGFHFSAELAYQFGDINADFANSDGDDANNVDISAWGLESFLGYTWDTPTNPTIKGGLTWCTGSDFSDYNSSDWNTFFTPASEIHPRLGIMDLVEPSNIQAWNLGYSGSKGNHSWGVDLWYFDYDNADPEINDDVLGEAVLDARNGDGLDDHLGEEVDLWYNYQYSKNLVSQFGIGWFNAGDWIEQFNDCLFAACDTDLNPTRPADEISTSDAWRIFANLLLRF